MLGGETGMGKTTLLHVLAGRQLVEYCNEETGSDELKVLDGQEIRGCDIGASMNSTTKIATVVC